VRIAKAEFSLAITGSVFYSGMNWQTADDRQNLILDLLDFLLAAFAVQHPGLETDHNPVQVLDLVDHLVGGASKSSEAPLFAKCAVTTVLQLSVRESSRFADRLLDGRSGNSPVIQECKLRVDLVDEPQSPDVLDPVEADAQGRPICISVDHDHPDFVLAACCARSHIVVDELIHRGETVFAKVRLVIALITRQ
jgi:hypothetical protein